MSYHLPPNGYVPPTRCYTCRGLIALTRVRNGLAWSHVSAVPYGHPVTLRPEGWYDTRTGLTRHEAVVLDREALEHLGGPPPVLEPDRCDCDTGCLGDDCPHEACWAIGPCPRSAEWASAPVPPAVSTPVDPMEGEQVTDG